MREIRFRVWDDIARKMWYPEEGLRACVTQVGSVCTDETDDGGILENRSYRLTALFYTGLKDKDGKEIYEGDMFWYDWLNEPILRVVEFYHGSFIGRDIGHVISMETIGHFLLNKLEIIGNIYENPELLEAK